MKRIIISLSGLVAMTLAFNPQFSICLAQGTAFTYQGRLNDGANPANGIYDLRFAIFDASSGGAQQGNSLTNAATGVTNGQFTVTLDFGNQFPGANRWLEIGVRSNGVAAFTTVLPRQPLTPSPYAITAGNVVSNGLASGTYGNAVTFNNAANSFSGAFTGNGASVTNVNALTLGGLGSSSFWRTNGNAGTTAGVSFLGTSDNQPLELKVNGQRALRLEPNTNGAPNVIAGSPRNFVAAGIVGATVAGGGAINYSGLPYTNSVSEDFGAIGGGRGNSIQAGANDSTIGGGARNSIQAGAYSTTIAGGNQNTIEIAGAYSTIGGGSDNSIQNSTRYSTIGGGDFNTIGVSAFRSAIGGGGQNTIQDGVDNATIGGGFGNTILGDLGTVPGGDRNAATNNAFAAGRRAKANHTGAFVWADSTDADFASSAADQFLIRASGGVGIGTTNPANALEVNGGVTVASGSASSPSLAFSGDPNTGIFHPSGNALALTTAGTERLRVDSAGRVGIGTASPEADLHVFRGSAGTVTANPTAPLVVESDGNAFINILSPSNTVSGVLFGSPVDPIDASVRYNNSGANRELSFRTLNSTRMVILTNGFVGIGTGSPTNTLHINGGVSATAFVNTSDRNAKENFTPVSPQEVLNKVAALPITTWNFKTMNDGRHMGPMAQDFYAAFGLGGGDTTITSIDPDGVALAAIQGLNQKLEEKDARLRALEQELSELRQAVKKLSGKKD